MNGRRYRQKIPGVDEDTAKKLAEKKFPADRFEFVIKAVRRRFPAFTPDQIRTVAENCWIDLGGAQNRLKLEQAMRATLEGKGGREP